jgi:hypothetical protein
MSAFDSSTMIAEFSTDTSKTCLEMPHMSTGQRKQVKKLLEAYPELRRESYGFGAERCLHLFKESHAVAETKTQRSASPLAISSAGIKSTLIEDSFPSEQEQKSASDSMPLPELILPLTLENLQVRNTFIDMDHVSADKRAVRSMPHGMFKQCLLSEAADALQETFYCDTPTSAGGDLPSFGGSDVDADHHGLCTPLTIGSLVQVEGLVKLPAYNGRSAVVEAWDEETGRFCILIAGPNGSVQAKVKGENLRMLLPCPR